MVCVVCISLVSHMCIDFVDAKRKRLIGGRGGPRTPTYYPAMEEQLAQEIKQRRQAKRRVSKRWIAARARRILQDTPEHRAGRHDWHKFKASPNWYGLLTCAPCMRPISLSMHLAGSVNS